MAKQTPKHMDQAAASAMQKQRNTKIIIAAAALLLVAAIAIVIVVVTSNKKQEEPTTTTTEAPTTVSTTAESTTEEESTEEESSTTTTEKDNKTSSKKSSTTTKKNSNTKDTASVSSDGVVKFSVTSTYAANHKYCIAVNTKKNRVTIYGKDENGNFTKPVECFICSCGKEKCNCEVEKYQKKNNSEGYHSHATPKGVFKTGQRPRQRWLKMVDNSYGQYTTNINGGSIWFHSVCYTGKDKSKLETEEFNKLGTQASLGCVRLCVRDAKWIYEEVSSGTLVFIYSNSVAGPISPTKSVPKIDLNSKNKGWDPTDPDKANPWK